ncbi:MAG: glycosyltransferase [Microscillaceae bacterium]|nr:glycosyltransferase [Microscillaceae bacterium]
MLLQSLPKITLITPSFNQGAYLEQCIRSVIGQNYPHLEYILIDGGSTDETLRVIRKYEKYLSYCVSEPDRGQSDAINKGLIRANGEIINWLNADDFYEKDTLWKVARTFMDTGAQVVGGRCRVFESPDRISHLTNGTDLYPRNLAQTLGWARTDQPATFFTREAVQAMGCLDPDLHYLMDRDWWIKYLLHFGQERVVKIPDVLVNFRLHKDSKTVRHEDLFQLDRDTYYCALARQTRLKSYARFLKKEAALMPDYQIKNLPDIEPELAEAALNYYLLLRADEHYAQSRYAEARRFLDFIHRPALDEVGLRHWYKLHYRHLYLPRPLIRVYRALRRHLHK